MKRNGKVEWMRFVFCVSVVLFHGQLHYLNVNKDTMHLAFFVRGYLGVEFFFLLIGFLLAKSVYRYIEDQDAVSNDLGSETLRFTFRKIKAIFPYHVVAFVFLFLENIIINQYDFKETILFFLKVLPSFLFIQKAGFDYGNLNRVEWYISCMIFAILIIYPICRRFYSMFVHVIAPAGGLLMLGWLAQTYGTFAGVGRWTGITFACMLRAVAEIGLGAVAFEIARVLQKMKFTSKQRKILTILEWFCWLFCFVFIISTIKGKYEIYVVFAMMAAIVFAFSGQTYGDSLFNNKVCYDLGNWSLPVYLSQVFALNFVDEYLKDISSGRQILLLVLLTIFSACVCKWIVFLWNHRRVNNTLQG